MKKRAVKTLSLDTQTIRDLSGSALPLVAGGLPTTTNPTGRCSKLVGCQTYVTSC